MTAASYPLSDTGTLLHRNLMHALRYPAMSVSTLLMPLVFLLLFKFAFGNTLGAGIGGSYINYLTPGMLLSMGILLGVAVAIGFRPHADALKWLGAAGIAALTALAMTWVAMAMGLSAKAPEAASNLPMPIILLPFLGSGFVPAPA
jgi:ABC-2 type transport system permease protein